MSIYDVHLIHQIIRNGDYAEVQLKVAKELIGLYQKEIRNAPGLPQGFCQGVLFNELLEQLNMDESQK